MVTQEVFPMYVVAIQHKDEHGKSVLQVANRASTKEVTAIAVRIFLTQIRCNSMVILSENKKKRLMIISSNGVIMAASDCPIDLVRGIIKECEGIIKEIPSAMNQLLALAPS